MSDSKRMRVAVLYGGNSGEHEISLQSAAAVINNMDQSCYTPIPVGIDREGHWYLNDLAEVLNDTKNQLQVKAGNSQEVNGNLSNFCDVVFPVLHGPLYEDGCMQGLLELENLPYVGCGVLASAIAMDKDVAKRLVAHAGIQVVPSITLHKKHYIHDRNAYINDVEHQLAFPVFVKPVTLGSSVGIHRVETREDLPSALEDAFQYDDKLLIEKGLNAQEIEVAVLGNPEFGAKPLSSTPGEICPAEHMGFYSYEAKYIAPEGEGATLLIPAQINEEETQAIQNAASQVFSLLEGTGLARVDFFIEKASREIFFNELNPIPGFTQISMYPRLWEASGVSFSQLLSRLIELAIARHERKSSISRTYG